MPPPPTPGKGIFPAARSRVVIRLAQRQEGQAECQHANAPPRQVPGRAVIVPRIAPRLPSQHWGQCRHHQGRACAIPRFCYIALMNKTDPENELQTLANELTRANTHFHFAERLNANRVNVGSANEFWRYTLDAHASIALLNLCRVYDYRTEGINLVNCLKSIDERALNPAQRKQLTDYVARCCRDSNDRLVVSLRTWRNKIIAHLNKKAALDRLGFDKDNQVEPDEMLLNLIPTGFTILEWCSRLHGKVTTYPRLAPGKDSCEKVLECLRLYGNT